MKHRITIEINAPTEQEALAIAKALIKIKNALSDKDLFDLALLLHENPGIVHTARKFLG